MKKVIGYIRVSTDHQDLERQKVLINKYCADNGFTLVRIIEDFGISGAETQRKGYLELQALTEENCDMIVVSELSRLSRNEDVMATLNTIYALIAKFDLVMLDDLSTIYNKGAKFDFIQFMGLAFKAYGAADERKKITERMKTGKYALIARYPMACMDSCEPFGFKKVPNPDYSEKCKNIPKSLLVVNDDQAPIIKKIFTWASEGVSSHKITDKLNSLGIKSQWGNEFGHSSVMAILKQPLYKGIRVYKDVEYPTGIEIVSPELWNKAQLAIQENKTRADKYTKHCNPLKGILKCPCGCNMQIVASGGYHHYACVVRANKREIKKRKGGCEYFGINTKDLIDILWYEVKYRILDSEYKAKSNEKMDALKAENFQLLQQIEVKKGEIESLKADQATIIGNMALVNNPNIIQSFEARVNEIDDKIKDVENTIKGIKKEITKNERKISDENKAQSIKELEEMTIEGKAEIFKNMFETVIWDSVKTRRGILVVNYKNGIQMMYVYKSTTKSGKIAINLPTAFEYNPETHKVIVKSMKQSQATPESPFNFSLETVTSEHSADEMIASFKGEEEYDLSQSIWG